MADFNVPESPVFEEKIRQLETTDPAHASVFNNILVKLFHNNVFNRKKQQEHEGNKQNPHKVTPTQIGAATVDALDLAYQNGNAYTDDKIAALINGAPNTMDTLKEISDAMAANKTVVDALEDSIGSKAPKAELDTHVANKTLHITAAERTKWNTVDTALSGTSTNPIQNKVVKAAFDQQNVKNSSLEGSIAEVNSNLGGNRLITEGSGANAKYYIQTGADAASKKLLGKIVEWEFLFNYFADTYRNINKQLSISKDGICTIMLSDFDSGHNSPSVKINNNVVSYRVRQVATQYLDCLLYQFPVSKGDNLNIQYTGQNNMDGYRTVCFISIC